MTLFRINNLRMRNFRGFREFDMPLHPTCTILHANNGGGKTATLEGLAVGLGAWFLGLPGDAGRISGRDVHRTTRSNQGLLEELEHYPAEVLCFGEVMGQPIEWSRWLASPDGRTTRIDCWEIRLQAMKLWAKVKSDTDTALPLLAYYGTQRLFRQLKSTKGKKQPGRIGRREFGYLDCLNPASSEKQLIEWLFRQAIAEAQSGTRLPHVAGIERAVLMALGQEFRRFYYDLQIESPCLVHEDGAILPWYRFSDGHHTFVGMVADLAWRAVTLNPQWGDKAPELVEGVVAIDEIDLHLHPSWQRRVLHDLMRAFPNLQFVVTTHSPQVLAGARREWVRLLSPAGAREESGFVEGRDSNAILTDIMGVSERPEEAARKLDELHHLLHERNFEEASRIFAELEDVLGPDDTTIVRARLDLDDARWS